MRRVALVVLSLLAATALAAPPLPLVRELLVETNAARAAHGAPPVRPSRTLAVAAQQHAEEMAELGYFSHVSPAPGRRTLADRLAAAGDPALRAAENLALYSPREELAAAVVQGWLESPRHRSALLDSGFTHVGLGAASGAEGELYVVQVFAWKPWQHQWSGATLEGRRLLIELAYDLPLSDVRAFADRRPVQTYIRGDRVVVVAEAGASELLVGSDRGGEVVFFDAFAIDAAGRVWPGRRE